jgi:hypothetical protein
MIVGVAHFTNQGEVRGRHAAGHRRARRAGKAGGGKVEIPPEAKARDSHFPTAPTAAAG